MKQIIILSKQYPHKLTIYKPTPISACGVNDIYKTDLTRDKPPGMNSNQKLLLTVT